ncbi:MAG: hypothetical protein SFY67_14665 [Candidatus Melainabacteria bacterium]|nr:hypothetical protein [Candidatus Melainabacteria bacterium]
MRDLTWFEFYLAAGNSSTPVYQLENLAGQNDPKIRRRVAENPGTPEFLLRNLAVDKDPEVRLAVASSPSCPVSLLRQLARDPDPTVRFGMAEDPNLPEDLLLLLTEDENSYVGHRAQRTLEKLGASKFKQEPIDIFRAETRWLYA